MGEAGLRQADALPELQTAELGRSTYEARPEGQEEGREEEGGEMKPLETDGKGNVILKPVVGWRTAPVGETFVLLAMEYVTTPKELETRDSKTMQFGLTAQQCLELAETLTRQAKRLGAALPPDKSPN